MLTDDEARTAYQEVLQKLRGVGAHGLADEIELAVGRGRVQERERQPMQERLPATAALEIALRMLTTWVEPVFLMSEAKTVLREASAVDIGEVRWAHDRLDIVEPDPRSAALLTGDGQAVSEMPQVDVRQLEELRIQIERLHDLVAELVAAEGE